MDTLVRMRSFLQVVQSGGFSAAARDLGRSKALISKYVGELEDELGARLLNRTTRQLSLTEAGQVFYREATDILQRIDDLHDSITDTHQHARGLLRVSAPRSMGDDLLNLAIMDFVVAEPEISLDLKLEDRFVDLVDEGYDVAIRVTELTDSSLIARKLYPVRGVVCATPAVIEKFGLPKRPQDLAQVPCIIDTNYRFRANWGFQENGSRVSVPVKGRVEVNSAASAREAAIRDLGFLRTPESFVHRDLAEGRLVEVLQDFHPDDQAIYAVYPHRRHLSGKVRAFVDFLAKWFQDARKRGDLC
ncbi:LysR family transcriptional regulator [Stappia sp. GBMRC 2046]|uniref:LysR family transcriptional regulator n=1 Tax=Stappia sediminis TaxID=2692190 RepID=A0A7X3LUD9_9HYPH|nr:LysR family transcriptional regulator [Stappia sediminis]MXN65274.1 LysR family transcriptional regulator [Stappia sediminis]